MNVDEWLREQLTPDARERCDLGHLTDDGAHRFEHQAREHEGE